MTHDVVVIGAGAAGIAAARTVHDAGRDVLLVEAAGRVGGRAWSIPVPSIAPATAGASQVAGPPFEKAPVVTGATCVDLGCGWLHSAGRNPWTRIARETGFTIVTGTANWGEQWRNRGYTPVDQQAFAAASERFHDAAICALPGPDRALAGFIAPDDPWHPMQEAISGYANGASLAEVSLHDWAAYETAATQDNWSVREGYGTLVASLAAGLDIRTDTSVTRIDHRGTTVRIETPDGTIEADRVIVAVPTPILADARLAFDPPLPDKHEAAAALPLGIADKVFLGVDRVEWPDNAHMIGNPRNACTMSYRLSPLGLPVIEGFYGGTSAEVLEAGDACTFAIDELVALMGSAWRTRFTPILETRWRHMPWIEGSYSHARIGRAGQRAVLAAPVENRIFFAGEACSHDDFSTAHGAYQTGVAAARAALSTLAAIA